MQSLITTGLFFIYSVILLVAGLLFEPPLADPATAIENQPSTVDAVETQEQPDPGIREFIHIVIATREN